MPDLVEPFSAPFMQRALGEVMMLSVLAGLLGAQIVLRRLAFFSHGVGVATFPGLVVAGPLGVPAQLAALAAGVGFAGALERLSRDGSLGRDAATALLLVTALGTGTVLASDVFESGSSVDQLLFGTLIGVGTGELAATGIALAVVVLASAAFWRTWLAVGFDESGAGLRRLPVALAERVLVIAVAIAVVAALDAVGALLVGAILVIPAATVRIAAPSVRGLAVGAALLAFAEGVVGLWVAYQLDVPPGPAIALVAGVLFAAVALSTGLRTAVSRPRAAPTAAPGAPPGT